MSKNLGVVVGRFQAQKLHEGYHDLFKTIMKISDHLLVIVGSNTGWPGEKDPLDFETRKRMIQSEYPNATILELFDHPKDKHWSNELDNLIRSNFPNHNPILYSSRDGFFKNYTGTIQHLYVKNDFLISSTHLRETVKNNPSHTEEFRAGIIYNTSKQFPVSFQTVDIALLKYTTDTKGFFTGEIEVLLGRKTGETNWRFPGGFIEVTDESLEQAARRELVEEVGDIEVHTPKYLSSHRVDDYRYKDSIHKIMTALFVTYYEWGQVKASDDLAEVQWYKLSEVTSDMIVTAHQDLWKSLQNSKPSLNKTQKEN